MTDSKVQFDAQAERYAASAVHHAGPSLPVLRAFAEPTGHDRVLDVATGTGSTAISLAPHVNSVMGIDVASRMLEQGRDRAARDGITNVSFLEGSAEALPFDDGAFTGHVKARSAPLPRRAAIPRRSAPCTCAERPVRTGRSDNPGRLHVRMG